MPLFFPLVHTQLKHGLSKKMIEVGSMLSKCRSIEESSGIFKTEHKFNLSILEKLNIKYRLLKKVNRAYPNYSRYIARRRGTMILLVVKRKIEE